ncbi:MAG: DUF2975 domain-containing protein [Chitinophagaceae bacterium]|nr:DUF2975 domain-containing protein [Chitinophagaceae bacterium]
MRKLLVHPIAILITLMFLAYFALIFFSFSSSVSNDGGYDSFEYSPNDTSFGGLLYQPELNDSLPHFQYQHIKDSLTNLNEQRIQKNETFISSWRTGDIGVGKIDDLFLKESDKSLSYYLTLREFELERDVKFFIEGNQYKLMYVAWDTLSKKGEPLRRLGTYKSLTIPIRYSAKEREIYIPITKTQYFVASVTMSIAAFLLLVLSLFVMFGYPIQFLVRISKGKAFTEKNINGLKAITVLMFVYLIFSILLPFLIRFIFSKFIHPLFKPLSVYQLLSDKIVILFVLTIVFAIYLAFKKGYKLQQEQELTV